MISKFAMVLLGIFAMVSDGVTPEKLAMVDPWYWAWVNKIKLFSGPFLLEGHEWQVHPMQSNARRRCNKKATQGGGTDGEVLRAMHGMIHGKYPQGVGYLFPTTDDVSDFSKARWKSLILNNPKTIGKYVTNTDAVNLKQIGNAFLYLRGARLSQKIANLEKESAKLRSFSADLMVYDEYDLMSEKAIEKARGRMGASKVKEESYLSNPTIPGYGIDKLYQNSDQCLWMIKCRRCGKHTCLEKEFPNCIHPLQKRNKRCMTGVRICIHCRNQEIFPCDGQWVPSYPNMTEEMEGIWWSQLMSETVDPGEILRMYDDPPEGNLGDVKRLKLGMAHVEADNKLTIPQVYACCGANAMKTKDNGPCAMGVDVGKKLHVIIGNKPNEKQATVLYANRVDSFNDVHDLAHRFNVKCAVIDFYPETRAVRAFQAQESYSVYGCDYLDRSTKEIVMDEEAGVLKVSRTEMCDETHRFIADMMVTLPRRSNEMDQFAIELTNTAKVIVTDEITGRRVGRYIEMGPDHYRHTLNYFKMALKMIPIAVSNKKYHDTKRDAGVSDDNLLRT